VHERSLGSGEILAYGLRRLFQSDLKKASAFLGSRGIDIYGFWGHIMGSGGISPVPGVYHGFWGHITGSGGILWVLGEYPH
jgi:hypothetical protein